MNFQKDKSNSRSQEDINGQHTMAVLSTLSGGEDVSPEGEPLGLDPESGKAKVSGSTLAVGVVLVLAVCALVGMKLTLGTIGGGSEATQAMTEIDNFITLHTAAQKVGNNGPIKSSDEESKEILEQLKIDPTQKQVPAEEVEQDPFDISKIVSSTTTTTTTTGGTKESAIERAKAAAVRLKLDAIAGELVFINGEQYRIGDAIAGTGFELVSVDGLTCIIRTTDEYKIPIRLRYR